ncbi:MULTISPECIES: hypothetical protein [Pyrobaculum]|uniref:DUF973 family protein n=2 Tax=Pyrobaculum arsenaticum TaxID=121277 RepID=A4WIX9_PYRAR|nr:hypothetical protein [Pyrobaculum arsenaticum]ABP50346.1 conserved hypothetical protein [Pyrobaculum arsenaticum DSM 13514]MCY0890332.1 hypothetical protein [Pyrobaculum arsenaticum]NYR14710.1 hypothetical protein [Pyrobaculum arsenaticum]
MGLDDLRQGLFALVIGLPILFFTVLGLVIASSYSYPREVVLPSGVKVTNPTGLAATFAVGLAAAGLLGYASWKLWRGYLHFLQDKAAAYGATIFTAGWAVFLLIFPSAMSGDVGSTLLSAVLGIALMLVGYVMGFILPAYRLYDKTKDGVFLAAVVLYAVALVALITAYIGLVLMYIGVGRLSERQDAASQTTGQPR